MSWSLSPPTSSLQFTENGVRLRTAKLFGYTYPPQEVQREDTTRNSVQPRKYR